MIDVIRIVGGHQPLLVECAQQRDLVGVFLVATIRVRAKPVLAVVVRVTRVGGALVFWNDHMLYSLLCKAYFVGTWEALPLSYGGRYFQYRPFIVSSTI